MSKNKKHGLIHFPFAEGFTPQRHKFLDGTWTSFFAPGQKPNVIGQDYQNPTDWNKAETLLRPPQVVWLEVRIKWSECLWWLDIAAPPGGTGPGGLFATSIGGSPIAPENYLGGLVGNNYWYKALRSFLAPPGTPDISNFYGWRNDQANVAIVEKWRLKGVFDSVKATIEALRPGRTWVSAFNWMDCPGRLRTTGEIEKNTYYYTLDHSDPLVDLTWVNANTGFIQTPDSSYPRDRWFGTDFLGVFCGNHFTNGSFSNVHLGASFPGTPVSADLDEITDFQGSYARILAHKDDFYGWSTRLYHPGITWQSWVPSFPGKLAYQPSTGDWVPIDGTDYVLAEDGFLPNTGNVNPFLAQDGFAYYPANASDDVTTGLNAYSGGIFDLAALKASADHLDVTHPGNTSLITEGYLVDLIAAHYRFDPITGKDLP